MLTRSEIKYIQSLCQKKNREQEKLFLAEGPKLAEELLNSDWDIVKIYALQSWIEQQPDAIKQRTTMVSEKELAQISELQTPNQVVLLIRQKAMSDKAMKHSWTIVLDGIQDPGNLGTIIRIADWFGVKQIVCSADTAELYNPKVVQSTMGSFVRVNIVYTDIENFLRNTDKPVYGAMLNGNSLFTMKHIQEGILVIGNESKGIRKNIQPFIGQKITIPRLGGAESLNAAVATGIILSHLVL
ncbi:MAG: RNA methyltransferase [Sphingobacteriia bacterium]|nr:RNA methyltransferase [Sphingobacteriia bacterium]